MGSRRGQEKIQIGREKQIANNHMVYGRGSVAAGGGDAKGGDKSKAMSGI